MKKRYYYQSIISAYLLFDESLMLKSRIKIPVPCGVNGVKQLEFNDIPSIVKEKALLVIGSIISRDLSGLKEDDHSWIQMLAKERIIRNFNRLQTILV